MKRMEIRTFPTGDQNSVNVAGRKLEARREPFLTGASILARGIHENNFPDRFSAFQ